jgi:hypothetical protein
VVDNHINRERAEGIVEVVSSSGVELAEEESTGRGELRRWRSAQPMEEIRQFNAWTSKPEVAL